VTLAVDDERAAFQRAVIDVQGGAGRCHMKAAPAGSRTPETSVSGRRFNRDPAIAALIVEAADGQQGAPRGHGASVMMAALGLVPRIAFFAVVTRAGVAHALDALGRHAGVDHVRS